MKPMEGSHILNQSILNSEIECAREQSRVERGYAKNSPEIRSVPYFYCTIPYLFTTRLYYNPWSVLPIYGRDFYFFWWDLVQKCTVASWHRHNYTFLYILLGVRVQICIFLSHYIFFLFNHHLNPYLWVYKMYHKCCVYWNFP